MFIGPNNDVTITIKDKEALVRVYLFSRPPIFQGLEYQSKQETAYLSITKNDVAKAFLYQSEKKHQDQICIIFE